MSGVQISDVDLGIFFMDLFLTQKNNNSLVIIIMFTGRLVSVRKVDANPHKKQRKFPLKSLPNQI